MIVAGSTADYGVPREGRYRFRNIDQLLQRNIKMQPFWVSDFDEYLPDHLKDLRTLYVTGRLKVQPPHVLQGLAVVPTALQMLLSGANTGKLIVQAGDLPFIG